MVGERLEVGGVGELVVIGHPAFAVGEIDGCGVFAAVDHYEVGGLREGVHHLFQLHDGLAVGTDDKVGVLVEYVLECHGGKEEGEEPFFVYRSYSEASHKRHDGNEWEDVVDVVGEGPAGFEHDGGEGKQGEPCNGKEFPLFAQKGIDEAGREEGEAYVFEGVVVEVFEGEWQVGGQFASALCNAFAHKEMLQAVAAYQLWHPVEIPEAYGDADEQREDGEPDFALRRDGGVEKGYGEEDEQIARREFGEHSREGEECIEQEGEEGVARTGEILHAEVHAHDDQREGEGVGHDFARIGEPQGYQKDECGAEGDAVGEKAAQEFVEEKAPERGDDEVDEPAVPMGEAEQAAHEEDEIVEQGELHAGDAREVAADVDAGVEDVGVDLEEVAGGHGHSGLTPGVSHLDGRVCDAVETQQGKQEYPETDIFQPA